MADENPVDDAALIAAAIDAMTRAYAPYSHFAVGAALLDENGQIVNSDNLKVHPRMKELYKFFKYNGKVEDVVDYDIKHLKIFSREVLKLINSGDPKWEDMLPKGVSKLIKEQKLFGYK